ncbi:hypothetical protein AVEN_58693-1 [Araneus ventricosus]|uniref:Uncharacterized protein n=1 Tax=Araneus ventricosus TaxID=182803 RepID=A0A4Y2NVW8_ARAVE|nr:hypothetical protein AVEN_95176-1 [Araneus ventricosus]GBN42912.1 hypothetical protein AVEN_171185-1 [Araneus ventricosus]GBN43406.1 hypothetical protein AVEN_99965-1 [Araneus ventricosus]GBN43445.1 hypothetical protein AVEN_58693-1 [Araneus ventricosus]
MEARHDFSVLHAVLLSTDAGYVTRDSSATSHTKFQQLRYVRRPSTTNYKTLLTSPNSNYWSKQQESSSPALPPEDCGRYSMNTLFPLFEVPSSDSVADFHKD